MERERQEEALSSQRDNLLFQSLLDWDFMDFYAKN